ncbi:PREDICTED: PTB domain-containing adapter protein ced-6 [Nicrophorus vespilloides]|uniref:PTB domain-containing adapter protein ced-6 n=1 Tax=Nicrophorus vespilloides TaxID=110193 RepID=A0ABM1NA62_NICVS|nr:PREDICTED: PTB domain-containing adapter protein ced-6 [Nicrophorus vespilloides]XP_017783713.1 PREDICTED: PTB domain-containing adapter protein ced-6 [Nicrophorus vespilloides]
MSTLLKWAQNTTQGKLNSKNNSSSTTNGERKWIHPPEALQKGHIAYLVKFLGNTVVDQPKGIEVVKKGIRRLQFSQQIKKSETGAKIRKVELTISADGVAIQEPKTHTILHQFPLHRISYCADDKGEKKFFSFIAKQPSQAKNDDGSDQEDGHECFVFISDKLAEEITLTIGQAFELAYKRFLETSGKDLESQRRAMITQQKIKRLENESNVYRQRLLDLSKFSSIKIDLDQYLIKHEIKNILEISGANSETLPAEQTNGITKMLDFSETTNGSAPPVPPRNFDNAPAVGTKLENLLLNDLEQDDDFDPRSYETHTPTSPQIFTNGTSSSPPLLAPPPKAARRNINNNESPVKSFGQDLFGATPFSSTMTPSPNSTTSAKILDPFEMGDFNTVASQQEIENAIGLIDKRILEMTNGFSRGISFGNEDFSLESLDPLKN